MVKNVAGLLEQADLHQMPGKMGPGNQQGIARMAHGPLEHPGNADGGKRVPHAPGPFHPAAAHGSQAGHQIGMGSIEAQPHHVDGMAFPFDGDFHPIDQGQPQAGSGLTGLGQAVDVVMVGQRQMADATTGSTGHHQGRRQQAIGDGGMAVEIEIDGG